MGIKERVKVGKYDLTVDSVRTVALSPDNLGRAILGEKDALDLLELAITGSKHESLLDKLWKLIGK